MGQRSSWQLAGLAHLHLAVSLLSCLVKLPSQNLCTLGSPSSSLFFNRKSHFHAHHNSNLPPWKYYYIFSRTNRPKTMSSALDDCTCGSRYSVRDCYCPTAVWNPHNLPITQADLEQQARLHTPGLRSRGSPTSPTLPGASGTRFMAVDVPNTKGKTSPSTSVSLKLRHRSLHSRPKEVLR